MGRFGWAGYHHIGTTIGNVAPPSSSVIVRQPLGIIYSFQVSVR